ncbi:lipopolysaccharide biosynthesis protein [Thauera sinica]|uniref:Lipopolysaccharide biosynthesis protein n=1 Tax=Thauera sinica TaxID=2665146 RepID=A0ABW1API3_9RHOO|nr:lipopolysaccharide biosynthesis protein [Thauera sp. K11]ATE62277.1 lipopolysaccharide biosynthesis protein [Thauera sp. K11]
MNKHIASIPEPAPVRDDAEEIHLSDLVPVLWQRRRMICCLAGLGALLGLGISLASTRYVSEGIFMAHVPIGAYKRYESVLLSGPRLAQFVQRNGTENDAASARILKLIDSDAALRKALRLEFGFTDRDAKTFGVQAGKVSDTVDVRLRYESPEPIGGAPLALLAEFVRDTVIRVDMEETILRQCNDYRIREQTLRNEQLQNGFDIGQQEERAATLRTLTTRNPDTQGQNARQIVAVDKGTERFLSPQAQLTAVEIQIADMRLDDARRERERVASALKRDYYCEAQQALQGNRDGRAFLAELGNIQKTVFEGKDRSANVVEQTWNELDLQRGSWANDYLVRMRFIASPDRTENRERKPGTTTGAVLGLIVGGMLGVFMALALGWWTAHRRAIVAIGKV